MRKQGIMRGMKERGPAVSAGPRHWSYQWL